MNSKLSNSQVRSSFSECGVVTQSDDDLHNDDVSTQVDMVDVDSSDEYVVDVDVGLLRNADAQEDDDEVIVYGDDSGCTNGEDDAVHVIYMRGDIIDGCSHGEDDKTHDVMIISRRLTRDAGACCEDVDVVFIRAAPITSEVKRLEGANDAGAGTAGCAFVEVAGCNRLWPGTRQRFANGNSRG